MEDNQGVTPSGPGSRPTGRASKATLEATGEEFDALREPKVAEAA